MDVNRREIVVFVPLLLLTIFMGVYPMPFLEIIEASSYHLVEQHKIAMSINNFMSLAAR